MADAPASGEPPPWARQDRAALIRAALAVLALSTYALLLHGLFEGELKPLDDGWNAGVARRMAEGASWLSPTLQDGFFHNHGALLHWLAALLFRAFGPHPGLARLPGALAGVALVAATLWAGRRTLSPYAGFVAAVALVTCEPFFHQAPRCLMDSTVTLFVFLAVLAIDHARTRPWPGYLAAGLFTGLAILTKDLAGLAPLPIAILLPLVERRPRDLLRVPPLAGLAVAAAVVAAWLVPQVLADGGAWMRAYLDFARWGLTEGQYPDRGPLYFVARMGTTYWPWLPILVVAVVRGVRSLARGEPHPLAVHLVAFAVIFAAWSAAAHKRPGYMMMFYPSSFLVVAAEVDRLLRWPPARAGLVGVTGAGAIGLLVAQLAFGFNLHPVRSQDGDLMRALAPAAAEAVRPADRACSFRVHHLYLVAGFAYYRGPTVDPELHDAAAAAYLTSAPDRRCVTTREGLAELGGAVPVRLERDGFLVIGSP